MVTHSATLTEVVVRQRAIANFPINGSRLLWRCPWEFELTSGLCPLSSGQADKHAIVGGKNLHAQCQNCAFAFAPRPVVSESHSVSGAHAVT